MSLQQDRLTYKVVNFNSIKHGGIISTYGIRCGFSKIGHERIRLIQNI